MCHDIPPQLPKKSLESAISVFSSSIEKKQAEHEETNDTNMLMKMVMADQARDRGAWIPMATEFVQMGPIISPGGFPLTRKARSTTLGTSGL